MRKKRARRYRHELAEKGKLIKLRAEAPGKALSLNRADFFAV